MAGLHRTETWPTLIARELPNAFLQIKADLADAPIGH